MMRPSSTRSPRSVMRTTTERLLLRFTTRTTVPKGSVGWQAVIAFISNTSPLAVCRPLNTPPYQEAMPWSLSARRSLAVLGAVIGCASRAAGGALANGGAWGVVAEGRGSSASACTVRVEIVTTTAASATEEAPARRQIFSGVFKFLLRDFLFITIPPFY